MDNVLLMKAMLAEREREVKAMTPSLADTHRLAVRATVARALARLALRIDRDTTERATAPRSVDFRQPLSSR
jgi:hypothetical protein